MISAEGHLIYPIKREAQLNLCPFVPKEWIQLGIAFSLQELICCVFLKVSLFCSVFTVQTAASDRLSPGCLCWVTMVCMFSVNSDHAVTCLVSLCTIVDLLVVPPSFLCQKQCVCGNCVLIYSKEIKYLSFLCSQSLLNSTVIIILMPAVIALLQSNVLYSGIYFCSAFEDISMFSFWKVSQRHDGTPTILFCESIFHWNRIPLKCHSTKGQWQCCLNPTIHLLCAR